MGLFDFTSLRFDQPHWLWLNAIIIPIVITGWLTFSTLSISRKVVSLILRSLLVVTIAAALAEPTRVQRTDDLAVIALSAGGALLANALSARLAPVRTEPGQPPPRSAPAETVILEGEIIDSDPR